MKKEIKDVIVGGMEKMYETSGEMVPYWIITLAEEKYGAELVTEVFNEINNVEIVVVTNPYGTGDNFMGLKGKTYAKNSQALVEFRSLRRSFGNNQTPHMLVETMTL